MVKVTQKRVSIRAPSTSSLNKPIAIAMNTGKQKVSAPSFKHSERGVTISHHEFIQQVVSSATANTFDLTAWGVNPGNALIFPWLSKMAMNYEKFRIKKLELEYIPACGTTTAGTVMAFFDYDVSDQSPPDMINCLNNYGAKPCNVYQPFKISYDRSNDNFKWFFNTEEPYGSTVVDPRLKYCARLFFAWEGVAANLSMGLLRVNYEIELEIPQTNNSISTVEGRQSYALERVGTEISVFTINQGIGTTDLPLTEYRNVTSQTSQLGAKLQLIDFPLTNITSVQFDKPGIYTICLRENRPYASSPGAQHYDLYNVQNATGVQVSGNVSLAQDPSFSYVTYFLQVILPVTAFKYGVPILFRWFIEGVTGALRGANMVITTGPTQEGKFINPLPPLSEFLTIYDPNSTILEKSKAAVIKTPESYKDYTSRYRSNENFFDHSSTTSTPSSGKTVEVTPLSGFSFK